MEIKEKIPKKMKYGSLTEYKKYLRNRKDWKNPSEQEFEKQANILKIEFIRKGYPDYILLKDNEIIGFVEVKPSKRSKLKSSQQRFKRFCEKYGVPFFKWSPDEELNSVLLTKKHTKP